MVSVEEFRRRHGSLLDQHQDKKFIQDVIKLLELNGRMERVVLAARGGNEDALDEAIAYLDEWVDWSN